MCASTIEPGVAPVSAALTLPADRVAPLSALTEKPTGVRSNSCTSCTATSS